MNDVFVSVLMPVYNAEEYLKDAIESILNQTYKNFEFVIINDGSADKSKEIILSYPDSRIVYYENEKNIKVVATLNKGFDLCRGKYIIRMDADDISLATRIEKQVQFMEANPEVGIAGTAIHSFGFMKGDHYYKAEDQIIRYKFLHECHLSHPSSIIRTDIIRKHHLKLVIDHVEDYDFFLQIADHSKMANLQEVLLEYRQSENSTSKANSDITLINSNIVRLKQFRRLDSSFELVDVILYGKLANQNYGELINDVITIESLLKRLIAGNLKHDVYQKDSFNNYITEMWFAFLNQSPVNNEKYRKMLHSELSKFRDMGLLYKLKLSFKRLLDL